MARSATSPLDSTLPPGTGAPTLPTPFSEIELPHGLELDLDLELDRTPRTSGPLDPRTHAQDTWPVILRPTTPFTDDQLHEFGRTHPQLRVERSANGELIIMPPTGGTTGRRNSLLVARFTTWAERDGTGITFDSSTGFVLPSGAIRSPDLAWVQRRRWDALSEPEQEGFVPLCPDVVVELRSRSDGLPALQAKCDEYVAAGARLVWLVDPIANVASVAGHQRGRVHVHHGGTVTVLEAPSALSGASVLDGLSLDLRGIL